MHNNYHPYFATFELLRQLLFITQRTSLNVKITDFLFSIERKKLRCCCRVVKAKPKVSLKDAELINQFKKIAVLPEEEKTLVLKMITAYVRDFNTQQAYAS